MAIFTHVWVSWYETKVFRRFTVVNETPRDRGVTLVVNNMGGNSQLVFGSCQ